MDKLKHSSLGEASLTYNTDDQLTKLTLGNGAYTDYTYDTEGRRDSFDLKEADTTRLMKHDWTYDELGMKGDINVTGLPTSEPNKFATTIELTYNTAGQLTQEKAGTGPGKNWLVDYDYDTAGNRDYFDDDTDYYDITYGLGNRESEVLKNGAGMSTTYLNYDFKGNVTSRKTLAGGSSSDPYLYTWDEYDRMTQVTRTGQDTVNYYYDAGGRLLRRQQDPTGDDDNVISYWLGLNKIAEERWGGETGNNKVVIFPDDETAATPENAGWGLTGGSGTRNIVYATDTVRDTVVHITTTNGGEWDVQYTIGDNPNCEVQNPNDTALAIQDRKHLGIWIKNANTGSPNTCRVVVVVETDNSNLIREMYFTTNTGTDGSSGDNIFYYIGTSYNDQKWHYLEWDLEAQLDAEITGENILKVHAVRLWGNDLYADDLVISGGAMEKSYQINMRTPIAGYIGAQQEAETSSTTDQWHYHYNELGTVLATTDENGDKIGRYEPDYFGNYRYINGTRPDSLGFTSKFYDDNAGLYYFAARWYDPERGVFQSRTPIEPDIEHQYRLADNNPANRYDPTGYLATCTRLERDRAARAFDSCHPECKGRGVPWCGSKAAAQCGCIAACVNTLPPCYRQAFKKCGELQVVTKITWHTNFPFMRWWTKSHTQCQYKHIDGGTRTTDTGIFGDDEVEPVVPNGDAYGGTTVHTPPVDYNPRVHD